MRRDPGHFLERAREVVQIVGPDNGLPREVSVLRSLTAEEDLERQFPPVVEGTPYAFFSQNRGEKATVVVSDPQTMRERVFRETALGIMDSINR